MPIPIPRKPRKSSWSRLALILAAGAALSAAGACSPAPPAPNIILISIDALRADRLGCYGYPLPTTPSIDRLADGSVLFRNAITPRPKTSPSMASMLTGLYPHTHGVRTLWYPLPEGIATLAELIRERGYRTAAVVGNYVLKSEYSGLDRGFDHYDDRMPTRELNRNIREKTADQVNEAAFRWLEEHRDQSFFLWLHYQDPHGPYTAPPEFRDLFRRDEEDLISDVLIPEYQRLPWIAVREGEADAEAYRAAYDAEIRYCDEAVGRLLGKLAALGLGDTVIILVSDHGESLGEHDYYFEHGNFLYDQSSRVPLIIHVPGLNGPDEIAELVNVMSIAPTVLDLCDIPIPAEMEAPSLIPLLSGRSSAGVEAVFIERSNQLKAVRTVGWKYIRDLWTGGEELYDLAADPGETENTAEDNPEICREMNRRLEGWMNADDRISLAGLEDMVISPEERSVLLSLGYLK